MTKKYPNVFFNFQSFPYSNFNSLPLSQYPDFSFCYITASFLKETFILPPDYSFSYVCEEPYYVRLWMSKYHPYANIKQLSYEQVKSLNFVYLSTIFHSKDIIEAHFGKEIISDNTYQAQNWPILLSMIRNHHYVTTDIVRNNIPIINPKLAEEKDLLQKELPKSLSEVFFVLIYKNSHQKFYPDIIQYLRDKFCF